MVIVVHIYIYIESTKVVFCLSRSKYLGETTVAKKNEWDPGSAHSRWLLESGVHWLGLWLLVVEKEGGLLYLYPTWGIHDVKGKTHVLQKSPVHSKTHGYGMILDSFPMSQKLLRL